MNEQLIKPTLNLRPYAHSAPLIVGACIQTAKASGWPDDRIHGFVIRAEFGSPDRRSMRDYAVQLAERYFTISL